MIALIEIKLILNFHNNMNQCKYVFMMACCYKYLKNFHRAITCQ